MHRAPILQLLERYLARWPGESEMVSRIRRLVETREDCLLRTCEPGHITASSWIVSSDHASFLMTHHRKLDKWLQLGGHVDGEPLVHRAALREAREESGLESLDFHREDGEILVVDVDVHDIPAHRDEPPHEHHDIRYLLVANAAEPLRMSDESNDLRWFPNHLLEEVAGDDSVVRLARKAMGLLRD